MALKSKLNKSNVRRPRAIAAERLSLSVSVDRDRPLFAQIREQIRDSIVGGMLLPGMRLPPVRALAEQLGVNQITVARAYRELAESKLLEGRRGGGSFVRAYQQQPAPDNLANKMLPPLLAERLFELSRAPGVISFSSNYPALDDVSEAELRDCLLTAASEKLDRCLHYGPPLGRPELRKQIQIYLKKQGTDVDLDNVMVTSGGQQAIDLAARALIAPGSPVAIEQPAYYGALNAFRGARARILEVPLEQDGMNLEALERYLVRDQARVIYTNPTFQNPTGVTMSEAKRRALLTLARRFGAVIVEDDHSHELRFSGKDIPAIRSLADDDDLVLYARGFGKTFLPGMRLGYLVMPEALRQKLLTAKSHADLHSNSFIQEAVALYLSRQNHLGALKRIREKYAPRQRLLYQCLTTGMPPGTSVYLPEGGLSLWLTLPEGAEVSELYFKAVRRGVAFVAGDVFYASPSNPRSLRISFGLNEAGEMEDGVARLCSVVKDLLNHRRGAVWV